jgi:hypothetical protein
MQLSKPRPMGALVLIGSLLKSHHGRMPRLYRSKEPHSDLTADGPHHLDREPVTGQQFNRDMFSNCDPEGAVDAKAAPRVIHDYDASTEPIMAVKERGECEPAVEWETGGNRPMYRPRPDQT